METWSLATLLLCFAGGILGTALGGIFAFVICGALVLAGCYCVLAGGSDFLLLQVGLGPIFGPHTGGFAAGVAAATYAVKKGNHPTGAAKDIIAMLADTSWDVYLMGGVFAVLGHALVQLFAMTPVLRMTDCVALSVFATALIARLVFLGESPFGKGESIKEHGLLGTNNGAIAWIPWQYTLDRCMPIGFAVGMVAAGFAAGTQAYLAPQVANGAVAAGSAFVVSIIMVWGIGTMLFPALIFGNSAANIKIPIIHGMGIISGLAYMMFFSGMDLGVAVFLTGLVGAGYAAVQELMSRVFYDHGSNHIDPPATAIALCTLILNLVKVAMG